MLRDTIKVTLGVSVAVSTIVALLFLSNESLRTDRESKTPQANYIKVRDYSRLTLETCHTAEECDIATAIKFYQDYGWSDEIDSKSIPILEPQTCEVGDKKCEEDNRKMGGKPASYPAICEPYIFSK